MSSQARMQSSQIRLNVQDADRLASQHDFSELDQVTVLELRAAGLRKRRYEIFMLGIPRVLGEGFAVQGINTGRSHVGLDPQSPQDISRRFGIAKGQRSRAVAGQNIA